MILYRVISEEEWVQTKRNRKVPRCKSDERDNCVHLTKYEDVIVVANKYFESEEQPVVLEVDVSDFQDQITWMEPTIEKPWHQPNAAISNIIWKNINRYATLIPVYDNNNEFSVGEFLNPDA